MKKFSTATLVFALAAAFSSGASLAAEPGANTNTAGRCAFLPNAPDQHLVVRGDTLWGISSQFLEHAWCWPAVWDINKEQIANPHWIYPGQTVYFDRAAGKLRLGSPVGGSIDPANTVKLSPQVRIKTLGEDAIPSIPARVIEPFLSQPLIIEQDELAGAPRIVATQEGRVHIGKNDKAYVRGDLKGGTEFQAFHPGRPLKDPVSGQVIGYEAVFLGTLKMQRAAKTPEEADTFTVVSIKEEMGIGDRLVPIPATPLMNYVPHLPAKAVDARIVSIYGGVSQAGQNMVVSVNRGKKDGMDVGTVLDLYRLGEVIADRTDGKKPVKIPDTQYGSLFLFRIFNNVSYGLVMQVREPVQVGDIAKSPE